MIFKDIKTIFVHIPKTGGTTITSGILSSLDSEFGMHKLFSVYKKNNVTGRKRDRAHITALDYKKKVKDFDNYWKFTIIRNPFEQILSLYKQLTYMNLNVNKRFEPYKTMSFEEFIMSDDPEFSMIGNSRLINQKKFITDEKGNIIVDKIYIYKDFNSVCNELNKKLNVNIDSSVFHRKTFEKDNYNPDMIERVLDKFGHVYGFYKEVKNGLL